LLARYVDRVQLSAALYSYELSRRGKCLMSHHRSTLR
jgi:hypothetical protein